jgi:hypothetical protein
VKPDDAVGRAEIQHLSEVLMLGREES